MLKLDSVYIKGFKSFAMPTKFDVSSGITAVVGPNGSGKSNVVDAIRWMFGEQSMKNIRADSREDVIFNGSERFPPSNSAEVRLVFESEEGTFSIAREISRDGQSMYKVNDKQSRLRDIRELFQGTGVGMDIYSIVGQGQVDKVVTASPYELRALIEEAAGTAVYKERKKEALGKLAATEENLSRLEDIIFELGKQRKSLYLKAKRAEKFVEYSAKQKELKNLYFGNIARLEEEKLISLRERFDKARDELKDLQKKLIEGESNWSALRAEFSEVDKEIEGFTKLLEEYKKRQNDLLELKEMYTRRLSEKENRLIEVSTRIDNFRSEIDDLDKRKDEIKLIIDSLEQQISDEEAALSSSEEERDSLVKNYSAREREWLKHQESFESISKRLSKIENELERLDNSREDTGKRLRLIESQLEAKSARFETLKDETESLAKQGKESTEKQRKVEGDIGASRERLNELDTELEKAREKLSKDENELRRSQMERSLLERQQEEYQGFSKAVREVFSRKDSFAGLRDVVANLIQVPESYETAITILLGYRMQDIVVDDSITAKRVIEFLKTNKIGRVTLLPMDMIEGNFRNFTKVESHPGFINYAARLVDIPFGFEKLPVYLFANSVVARSLDDAIEMRKEAGFSGRIVSVDGQLLSAGGSITGGFIGEETRTDLLSRKRRIQELLERETELEKEIQLGGKQIGKLKDETIEVRGYLKTLQEELNELASKGAAINRMISELLKSAQEVEEEISELTKLENEYTRRLEENSRKKELLVGEQTSLREERLDLEKKVEAESEELKKQKKALEQLQETIVDTRLRLSTLYEKHEQYTKEHASLIQKKKNDQESIELLSREVTELESETERLRKQVADQERELSSVKKETENLFSSIRYQREGKEQRLSALQEAEEEITRLKDEREKLREQSHQIEMHIQESEMKLSRVREEFEEDASEIQILSEENLKDVKVELDDYENKLKFLGSVDLEAIDEYGVVDKEYQELDEQKRDLEEAKVKLIELIDKTDAKAKNIFMETFNNVNSNFSHYIKEIFDGGEGEIKIIPGEDLLETGLEITVRRPGRKVQKLQLLSGGEKALVGIALVFSLLSIKPSPFYVLDEVDAPLDDFNAERFRVLLRKHATDTQFLVVTHNKLVMEVANVLHGVTMTDGLSRVIPVELKSVETVIG
ncbi:chromosome segregation protein SMC [Mesotoga sp. UBA5557]|jgi:chromosome segregation protein|uniref:chromosome segregation protein SMC n=1 Tax=Mesotoga sp. UBA5557 TaxID=1946857 RepID=UPI0025FF868B|nr:chromosome segregation protein SMC [Mesotoga sp. UBA5557]